MMMMNQISFLFNLYVSVFLIISNNYFSTFIKVQEIMTESQQPSQPSPCLDWEELDSRVQKGTQIVNQSTSDRDRDPDLDPDPDQQSLIVLVQKIKNPKEINKIQKQEVEVKYLKNDHKNTVKNFMFKVLHTMNLDIQEDQEYFNYIEMKKKISNSNNIGQLRQFWINQRYGKKHRIIFENFLRKRAYSWIFKSQQIKNKIHFMQDRALLLKKIKDPKNFRRWINK